mgnify:CR=1 FL=1|tara:strand:+ start:184 stop:396 length:213 start_codon:yes stop_codon:yes gene_type:complete
MGGIFGGGPKVQAAPGPTAAEIEAQERADKKIADEEDRKEEEQKQIARNRRGRRSLLSESNTGSGYTLGS